MKLPKKVFYYKGRSLRFYKYFISYILLLMLILIILSSVVYKGFISTLRSEVEASNISTLEQIKDSMNTRIMEMERTALNINSNQSLKPYKVAEGGNDSLEAVYELGKYKSSNDFIYDILLYYNYNNIDKMVHTTETSTSLDMFFNAYYVHENFSKDQFLDMVKNIKQPVMRPVEKVRTNVHITKELAMYIYPLSANTTKPYGVVAFYINQSSLKSTIKNVLKDYNGYFYILDEKKTPIIYITGDDNKPDTLSMLETIESKSANSRISSLNIQNTDYSIVKITSDYNNWSYITVMPTNQFMKKVYTKRNIFNYMIFIVLVLGTVLAFLLTVENYKPLRELLNSISGDSKDEGVLKNTDEFAYISRIVNQITNENKLFAKKQFLKDLIKEDYDYFQKVESTFRNSDITLDKQCFKVLVFLIDEYEIFKRSNDETLQGVMKFSIVDVLEELVKKSSCCNGYGIEPSDERSVVLLLNFASEFNKEEYINELVNKVKDIFKQYFTLTVGIGSTYDNINMVHESFLEATRAVYYRFIKGKDNVIFYEDVKLGQEKKYKYPVKLENRLTMAIKQGKSEEVENITEEIKGYIAGGSMSLESAQYICFGIINAVMKVLDEMEIDSGKCFSDTDESLLIKPYETIDSMGERLVEFCRGICKYIDEQKESKNYQLRDKILGILKEHYNDSMISLESIADECGMSPSYISRFFKDHNCYSPTQYIDMLRMEEARELLKTTKFSLKEIIEKVGYVSEANFIRKFKKIEGMTPMQYRNVTNTGALESGKDKA